MRVYADLEDVTEDQWRGLRKAGLGGSDAAAALGKSKYTSRYALWAEKTGRIEGFEGNEATFWGNTLEPILLEHLADELGLRIEKPTTMFQHADHDWMLGNVDGLTDAEVVEIKTGGLRTADGWAKGAMPAEYMLQTQHYLAVTGRRRAVVGCLIGGQTFEIRDVEANDELIGLIIDGESAFWDLVMSETAPEVDGSDSTSRALSEAWLNSTVEGEVQISAEVYAAAQESARLRKVLSDAKKAKDAVDNIVREAMKESTIATFGDQVVATWTTEDHKESVRAAHTRRVLRNKLKAESDGS